MKEYIEYGSEDFSQREAEKVRSKRMKKARKVAMEKDGKN